MDKYASLFSSLSQSIEHNIYVDDDYSLIIVGRGDVECRHGWISNVYHVPSLSMNLFLVAQLT